MTVSSSRKNKRGTLVLGLLLVGLGAAIVLAPSGSGLTEWLMRLWPVFLVCAGVARVMGFAVERKPRSPVGGMLLIIIGVLFFVSRFHAELNALQIYGRYWIVLLAVFAAVELVRFYSHHHADGPVPRLFTVGKLVVVLLIAGTGIVANRVSSNPSLASALNLKGGWLDGFRNGIVGNAYSFDDEPVIAALKPGGRVTVNNNYGAVRVTGTTTSSVRATLKKSVRGWKQDEARATADRVKLTVTPTDAGLVISTNRDQVNQEFITDILLEIPSSAPVSINGSYGAVRVNNIQAAVDVRASHGQVEVRDIKGDFVLEASYADINASNIGGKALVRGVKVARLSAVAGSLNLTASNGQVEIHDIAGEVHVEAPFSRVSAFEISGTSQIKTENASVEIAKAADVTIVAPNSDVRAKSIEGDLNISSSNSNIQAIAVSGDLVVQAERSSVTAEDVRGAVNVETSYRDVTIRDFTEGVKVRTSYNDVTLVASSEPEDDIEVQNNRGAIKLVLPESSHFQLDAASDNGQITPVGFTGLLSKTRQNLLTNVGDDGPSIKLKTSYKNIVIQGAGGTRQARSGDSVN